MLATRTTSMNIGSTATATGVPSWEEQIVPTLKKQLESESAYITNRLSATHTQFDDDNNNNYPLPPSHPFAADTTPRQHLSSSTSTLTFPSQIPVHTGYNYSNRAGSNSPPSLSQPQPQSQSNVNIRSRTKSGPMPIGSANDNNINKPSSSRKTGTGVGLGIKNENHNHNHNHNRQREVSVPLPDTNTSDHSAWQQTNGTQQPSRIPMRPRSKSQLGPRRPSPTRLSSTTPPIPIPHLNSSGSDSNSTSNSHSGSSTPRIPVLSRTSSAAADTGPGHAGRTSPDLNTGRIKEALVKNELPPFRMLPEEALRIAERGHNLHDIGDGTGNDVYALYGLEDDEEGDDQGANSKRKRAVTMRGDDDNDYGQRLTVRPINSRNDSSGSDRSITGGRKNSRPDTAAAIVGGRDLSRSTTESGLGLGHPARRFAGTGTGIGTGNGNNGVGGSKVRSSSNRTTNGLSSSTTSSGSFAPRSASLNLLATSSSPNSTPTSRLGVAAHFIPPESNYTPPKGTDWDDVVLPAVAKKLGMTDGEKLNSSVNGSDYLTEEDFAVEWDKDGTPIRWVKRKVGANRLDESTSTANTTNDGMGQSRTAFSPSFEPSPDNPMYQPKSSSTGTGPGIRYQRSQEGLGVESNPIRTTSSRSRGLTSGADQPLSPAPFSSLAPDANPNPDFNQGAPASLSRKSSSSGNGIGGLGLGRKPSLLRKQASDISRQESSKSLRNQYQLTNMNQSYIHQQRFGPGPGPGSSLGMGGTPHTPGTTHGITDAIYANDRARREGSKLNISQSHAQVQERNQKYPAKSQAHGQGRGDGGSHGKGCGCVIM